MAKKTETKTSPPAAPTAGHGGSYVTHPETGDVTLAERGGQAPETRPRRGFGCPDAAAAPVEQPKE